MNKIELTGRIVGAIDCTSEADGTEAARANLEFSRGNGLAKIFAFRERALQLAQFAPGDVVSVRGRLTINPANRLCAVLVDDVVVVQHFRGQECAEPRSLHEDIADVRHAALRVGKRERWR
jgi:hypothetical protein